MLAVLVVSGCKTSGCERDTDCKGERICSNRQCVDPKVQSKAQGVQEKAGPKISEKERRGMIRPIAEAMDKAKVGLREYFVVDHWSSAGTLVDKEFPKGNTGWTPSRPCCESEGNQCQRSMSLWDRSPWDAMKFRPSGKHRYQLKYSSTGKRNQSEYLLEARADLDCDGEFSLFRLTGRIDSEGAVVTQFNTERELE